MPAPASMRQGAQFVKEATYGAGIPGSPSWKRFTSFGLGKSRNMGVASATPLGQTAATQGWIATEDSEFSIEDGVLSYDEVLYLLESAINKPTPTTPAGGTLSRERLYTIDQFAATSFQSYAIQQGDFAIPRIGTASGCTVQEWGFEVSSTDDTVGMTGNLIGWKLDEAIAPGTATPVDYKVAIPKHFKLYYANSFAALGTTSAGVAGEVSNAFTASFSIGDRQNLVRYLGNVTGSPSGVVETVPSLEFDLTIADEAAPVDTFLTNARAGTKQFFRLQAKHPVAIETTIFPEFTLDVCCVLRDGPSDDDNDGVQVVNFPYQPAYDSVGNKIFQIKVVNNITTL